MGAAESEGVYTTVHIQHPDLRDIRGVTRDRVTLMTATVLSQRPQFKQWSNQVKQLQLTSKDKSHLMMPVSYRYEQGGVCSTSGQVILEYEYYPKLLSAEIRDRMKDKKNFSEAELWYLLYVMVAARDLMVSEGYQIGDLQPRNIFLNPDQQVKVGCILSWPGQVSAYRKAVLEQGYGYLAPEDMERLRLGAMDNRDNTEAEIFSMGLTMLSASILQPMKDLYSVRDNKIDEQLFLARLALFQQDRSYSDIYRAVITNMLELEVDHRMSQEELSEFLFKHKDNLESKKALLFDNVGRKLQQSINGLLKKTNNIGWSEDMRTSGVSSLYPISKQNSRPHEQAQDIQDVKINMMKQSQPGHQDIINYQKKPNSYQTVPVSPKASRQHISFQRTLSPPHPPISPTYTEPQYIKQGEPTGSQMRTPTWNSPAKSIPSNLSMNTPTWNKSGNINSPPYQPPSQLKTIVGNLSSPRNLPLVNAAPPLSGTPYAQPQRIVRIQNQDVKPNYRPFQSIGSKQVSFNPSKQNGKIIEDSRITQEKSLQQAEGSHSVNNLLMQTRKGAFVEMSKIERKKKPQQNEILSPQKNQQNLKQDSVQYKRRIIQRIPNIVDSRVQDKQDGNYIQKQAKKQEITLHADYSGQIPISPIVPITPIEHLVEDVKKQGQITQHENVNKNSIKQQEITKEDKQKEQVKKSNPFSSSVKIWGVQKGKLTIQQVGSPNQSRNSVQEVKVQPKQNATQPGQDLKKTYRQQINQKITTQAQESVEKNAAVAQESQGTGLPNEARTNLAAEPIIKSDNYILIEQSSRTTQKPSHIREQDNKFTYMSKTMDGSFDECWTQLLKMLIAPQDYCMKIDEKKVQPCQNEHGQFIKVGPAALKVYINYEQGKIWCENLPSSRCVGDLLCGVIRDDDIKHYVWFNSSLRYKGKHFPSREVMEQALTVIHGNIRALKAD